MGVFLLNICRNNYCNILTPTFGNFWRHLEIYGIWKSGNLEIWKFSGIGWFWPISTYWVFFPLSFGHWAWFSTQIFKIPICLEFFQKFSGIWKFSGICCFGPISTYGASFPPNFSCWNWFFTQNFFFPFFWSLSRIFLEIWKFSGICFFGPIATYWVSFQFQTLSFGH